MNQGESKELGALQRMCFVVSVTLYGCIWILLAGISFRVWEETGRRGLVLQQVLLRFEPHPQRLPDGTLIPDVDFNAYRPLRLGFALATLALPIASFLLASLAFSISRNKGPRRVMNFNLVTIVAALIARALCWLCSNAAP